MGAMVTQMVAFRLAGTVVMLAVISFLVFLLTYLSPGNIITNITGLRPPTPAVAAALRREYGLNDPLIVQYWHWLDRFVHGNWGRSIRDQTSVAQLFSERVGVTLALIGLAFAFSVLVCVPLGVISARRAGGLLDRVISITSVVGLSAPAFAAGLLLLYLFSYLVPAFPPAGAGQGFLNDLDHLMLPAATLAIGVGAYIVRLTRTAMRRELGSDYVVFARSRGVAESRLTLVALRNAAIPVLTTAGLVLSYLVGATILVESTFTLPGLGLLLQESVEFKDFAVVQFLALFIAAVIAVVMLLVDLSYLVLSPEWRRQLHR
jgi:peptide/nickel transport system permease protein